MQLPRGRADDADRLRRLQTLTDAALAHLDLEPLLASLLARTREALEVDTCAVLLLDEETQELVARAAVGIEEEVERGVRIPVGRGFAGRVAAGGVPVVLDDVDHADVLNPLLREKGIKSLLGVPLSVGGEVLGVLHVGSLTPRKFNAQDVELLQLAGDRAAIGIEHARLFEAEKDARRHVEQMQSITDAALAHLEVDELLSELLPRIRDVLAADTCAVLLLDESSAELVARSAVGIEEEVEQGVRIPVGHGFAGRIAASRSPVVLDDVGRADVVNPILREKGIRSMVGVPLLVGGAVIGVLHVGSLSPRRFTPHDVELLRLAGDRAAIAVEHARLFEAEHRARQRLEHVQAVTDAALVHLEVDDLLAVLLPRIRDNLGADTCAVLLLDEETGGSELLARAAVGIEEEVEQGVRIPVGRGFAGRVAAEARPVILDDVDSADVFNPILRQKGIKSMLGVPLLVGNAPIGVLHVGTLTPRSFGPADVELLQLVAQRVALAIERARLHEETVRLDQLKLNFVAVASHELRTPATSVYGALATLEARTDLPDETRALLQTTAFQQADRLRRLLEQLLDLSRLDADSIATQPRPIVLQTVLASIAGQAVPGHAVELRVPDDLAAVADPLVLDRIVSNLLVNAVRYGEPPIVVSAEQTDRHLRVRVEDGGGGVAEHLLPHLFDRFTRGQETGGSGLGLAIARAYARAHGGDLLYERMQGGARFELVVPQGTVTRPG
ncbi:MAG TPA: GAF domain-containing protein [Gaiellaceae bacterium]|nr:GAF domain-containing protein [Gaiellaceae bacterium]